VVAFSGNGPGDSSGVFGQQFTGASHPVLGEFRANSTSSQDQQFASVAAAPNGDFVEVWSGKGQGDGSGVFLQRFHQDGTRIGGEVRLNSTTDDVQQKPVVAMGSDGRFVVVWSGKGPQDGSGVFLQRFNGNGGRIGGETRVNSTTSGAQS